MDEKLREALKDSYKSFTDQIFILYECFKESGFKNEEAFELTECYVRQTMFDNVLRNPIKKSDVLARYNRVRKDKNND